MDAISTAILTAGGGQALGNLVPPATEVVKKFSGGLKRNYYYIKSLDQNFETLSDVAEQLTNQEKDVNNMIKSQSIRKEPTHGCDTWFQKVKGIKNAYGKLKSEYEEIRNEFALCTRLKLSKDAEKMIVEMNALMGDLILEPNDRILRERHRGRVVKFPRNLSEVPSLQKNVEELIELLKDGKIRKIGIWGMAGIGKTTVLENLNEEVAKLQMFDIVVWVTASKDDSLLQIQQKIMKQLTSTVDVINDQDGAAMFISECIGQKKYLLILDEVCSEIELRDVGIRANVDGKVVFATRERKLCCDMGRDYDIKIEKMSRADAYELFCRVVGEVIDREHIKPIAERIVIQCGELPLVIRAVGCYLKGRSDEDVWRSTLTDLQSPNTDQSNHLEDVWRRTLTDLQSPNTHPLNHLEDVLAAFKLIYEQLDGSERECWLYGALFPEDHEICGDHLVECWKTGGLINIGSWREACEKGHARLVNLIDRCLFDKCQSIKHVKMPIIFRNAAIRIAQSRLLVRNEKKLVEHPSADAWKNARVISFINSNLSLPDSPECPQISTLFLQKYENVATIPENFFSQMSNLKTLDLYGTSISELPPSISMLTRLRGLYLNDCHLLTTLPDGVSKLQSLELLDICRSGISGVPLVIEELTSLQCLRVSFTGVLGTENNVHKDHEEPTMASILKKLTQLEELAIAADPNNAKWNEIAPAIAAELAKLTSLSALTFYFPSVESLEDFFQASISKKNGTSQTQPNYRSFNIYVGSHQNSKLFHIDISRCSGRRYLQYSGGKNISAVIKNVLKSAFAFELINHQDITRLSDFDIKGMANLEICVVESCSAMEVILDSNANATEGSAFPWLEELHLGNLPNLKYISRRQLTQNCFARLTKLILYECPNISHVISRQMGIQLKELQQLIVKKCSRVTEIFEDTQEDNLCPKLKILELVSLKELVSIHAGSTSVSPGLKKMEIVLCDKLINLTFTEMNARKLRHITCNQVWWETLTLEPVIRAELLRFCCFV